MRANPETLQIDVELEFPPETICKQTFSLVLVATFLSVGDGRLGTQGEITGSGSDRLWNRER